MSLDVGLVLVMKVFRYVALLILILDRVIYYFGRIIAKARAENWFPGKRLVMDYSTIIKHPERIDLGDDVWIGSNVSIGAYGGIKLGDRVRISHGAIIETGGLNLSGSLPYSHIGKPISIGKGVWVGANAIVLAGVDVGEQAVIAAGAIVTKDVPTNCIVAGAPAKVLGQRLEPEIAASLSNETTRN